MDELGIPYRETENGFEAQECFVDQIRRLEKEYKAPRTSAREILRTDIDRLLMQSKTMDELLAKLQKAGYTIKNGKYLAVKPKQGNQFIRLKSLGEHYSEYALRNRLQAKQRFEQQFEKQIKAETKQDAPRAIVLQTIQFYTISFGKDALAMKKREHKKPFSWTNDAELDKLLLLNRRINEGVTVEMLRHEFAAQTELVTVKEEVLQKTKSDLKTFLELKEQIEVLYEGKHSDAFTSEQAAAGVKRFPAINRNNYRNIDLLIQNETENLHKAESELAQAQQDLKAADELLTVAERVMGGTFVQTLVGEERQRREAKYVPNGLKNAN